MRHFGIIVPVVLTMVGTPVTFDPTVDDLARLMKEYPASLVDCETTVSASTSPVLHRREAEPQADAWDYKQVIESVYAGYALQQQVSSRYAASGQVPAHSTSITSVWTGEYAFSMIAEDQVVIRATVAPADNHLHGWVFDGMFDRYPARFHQLPQLLEEGHGHQQSVADGALTYSFHPADLPHVTIIIEAEMEPTFRLRRLVNESLKDGDPAKGINRNEFIIDEWQDYGDGIVLPSKARLIGTAFNRPGFENQWIKTVTTYERTAFKKLEEADIDPALFTLVYEPGMVVVDERLNLSFTVGERMLHLDGIVYELKEPLMEHPGDRLPELIKNATGKSRLPEPQPVSMSTIAPADNGRSSMQALLIALGAGVGTALLAFVGLRVLRR